LISIRRGRDFLIEKRIINFKTYSISLQKKTKKKRETKMDKGNSKVKLITLENEVVEVSISINHI